MIRERGKKRVRTHVGQECRGIRQEGSAATVFGIEKENASAIEILFVKAINNVSNNWLKQEREEGGG
jgi:(p)ppGpp synthase/HD superfamily hydrolase